MNETNHNSVKKIYFKNGGITINTLLTKSCVISKNDIICGDIDLSSVAPGTYKVTYQNSCGNEVDPNFIFDIIPNEIVSNTPDNIISFNQSTIDLSFKVSFPQEMENKIKVTLRKKDNSNIKYIFSSLAHNLKLIDGHVKLFFKIKQTNEIRNLEETDVVEQEVEEGLYSVTVQYTSTMENTYEYDKPIYLTSGVFPELEVISIIRPLGYNLNLLEIKFTKKIQKTMINAIYLTEPSSGSSITIPKSDYEESEIDETVLVLQRNQQLTASGYYLLDIYMDKRNTMKIFVPSFVHYDTLIKEIEPSTNTFDVIFNNIEDPYKLIDGVEHIGNADIKLKKTKQSKTNILTLNYQLGDSGNQRINGIKFKTGDNVVFSQETPIVFVKKDFKLSFSYTEVTIQNNEKEVLLISGEELYDEYGIEY